MNIEKLNYHAPALLGLLKEFKNILSSYIVPDSNMSEKDCINKLIGTVDQFGLQGVINEIEADEPFVTTTYPLSKEWPESSSVETTSYNPDTKILIILFKNGNRYHYKKVPQEVWNELYVTESIGKFINSNIKNKFDVQQVPAGAL